MLKKIARFILEPFAKVFRSFFDPRFFALESEIARTNDALETFIADDVPVRNATRDALRDALTLTNTRITGLEAYLVDAQAKLDFILSDVGAIRPAVERLPRSQAVPSTIDEIAGGDADLLNYAESHRGFRSQAGLWFNPPDVVRYAPGAVQLSAITERSVEVPFVISSVTSLTDAGASILDVGCAESLIPIELASVGYKVTGIDLREYPLDHPNLTTFATPLEEWDTDETYDTIVCLSSIEHFGLGTYGEEATDDRLDHRAMQILLKLANPEGVLVMTIPYGETDVTSVQRMYTRDDIDELLDGWVIDTFQVAEPAAHGWVIAVDVPDPAPTADPPVTRQVALITAHPDA